MNLHLARRMQKFLVVGNCLLLLAVPSFALKLAVNGFMEKPPPLSKESLGLVPPPRKVQETKEMSFSMLAPCYEAKFFEDRPVETEKPPPKEEPAPVQELTDLPFEWIGVAVHPEAKSSTAILLDKRTQKQVLVQEGKFIRGSKYKIAHISVDEVKIQLGTAAATLLKPKPWQFVHKSEDGAGSALPDGLIPVDDNNVIAGIEDDVLGGYGLREQDQVIAVAGKPVANLIELKAALSTVKNDFAALLIRRQEERITFLLPTQVIRQMLQMPALK